MLAPSTETWPLRDKAMLLRDDAPVHALAYESASAHIRVRQPLGCEEELLRSSLRPQADSVSLASYIECAHPLPRQLAGNRDRRGRNGEHRSLRVVIGEFGQRQCVATVGSY